MKKTYLITGGGGFIGSNFIKYIINKYGSSIRVINVDKITYASNLENLKDIDQLDNYKFYKVDICDEASLRQVFNENEIDFIINFAAESHVDRSINNPGLFIYNNIIGTQKLLNLAMEYWQNENGFIEGKRFLQVSTDEVYGSLGLEGKFTEGTPLDPRSPYSASKTSADVIVNAYFHTFNMPILITRCSNNYGPFQFPEKLIPLVINNALEGKSIPVYGDGKNVRDWLYVDDHCKAIDLVVNHGTIGEIYNIGGNNEIQNIEIVKLVIKNLSELLNAEDERQGHLSQDLIRYVKDRKGHDFRYAIDASKINRELGWQPEVSFEEGIRKTIKWYLTNSDWLAKVTSGEYQDYYNKIYQMGCD